MDRRCSGNIHGPVLLELRIHREEGKRQLAGVVPTSRIVRGPAIYSSDSKSCFP